MALLNIHDLITKAIDTSKFSIGIFLDLAKAFDTVDHTILIQKLEHYGVRGIPLYPWFKNYLDSRLQQVQCNGALSSLMPIKCGVPQGSNLGPLLFLLYINDLPNASKLLNIILFADDTNAFYLHDFQAVLIDIINSEILFFSEWFRANRLSLNVNKSCYITFRTPQKKTSHLTNKVMIDGTDIKLVSSTKFLGVYIDEHLTWDVHINIIANKIAKNLGVLRRIAYLLPSKILVNLYYTLINPYLIYGNIVWASNYYSRINCVFLLQKGAIRIIARDGYLAHTSLRFLELGIMKFGNINTYLIGNFLYKYSNHLLPKEFNDYFKPRTEVRNHFTRSSDLSVQFA